MSAPAPGSLWRHSKSGNPYVVVAVAKLEATEEEHVIYMRVDDVFTDPVLAGRSILAMRLGDFGDLARNTTWIRPLREWEQVVSWNDAHDHHRTKAGPRFVLIRETP